jgi:hypothetical protein
MKKSSLIIGAAIGALVMVASASAFAQSWSDSTTVSGRMYYDFTDVTNKVDGAKSNAAPTGANGANGTGFDITRFYVGIDHKFTDMFSANVTTDFQYNSTLAATEVYLKKAYIDMTVAPEFDVKAGATDMPWIPYVESIYGNRYIEKTIIDRQGFGTSSDWGLHASGTFGAAGDPTISYQASMVNGNGYKNPNRATKMDLEGRVSAVVDQWNFAVGGYSGTRGQSVYTGSVLPATPHKAQRFDALAAWIGDQGRVGVEVFSATDWAASAITDTTAGHTKGDKSDGTSVFGTYRFDHDWSAFARFDDVKPSKTLSPTKEDKYDNFGVTYSAFKNVDFSLVAKHDDLTSTISAVNHKTVNDELGVFAQFRY